MDVGAAAGVACWPQARLAAQLAQEQAKLAEAERWRQVRAEAEEQQMVVTAETQAEHEALERAVAQGNYSYSKTLTEKFAHSRCALVHLTLARDCRVSQLEQLRRSDS